jgi:hypothetical protein
LQIFSKALMSDPLLQRVEKKRGDLLSESRGFGSEKGRWLRKTVGKDSRGSVLNSALHVVDIAAEVPNDELSLQRRAPCPLNLKSRRRGRWIGSSYAPQ